jgi:hypothetical protein
VISYTRSVTVFAPSNTSAEVTAVFPANSGDASGRRIPCALEPLLTRLLCSWQGLELSEFATAEARFDDVDACSKKAENCDPIVNLLRTVSNVGRDAGIQILDLVEQFEPAIIRSPRTDANTLDDRATIPLDLNV